MGYIDVRAVAARRSYTTSKHAAAVVFCSALALFFGLVTLPAGKLVSHALPAAKTYPCPRVLPETSTPANVTAVDDARAAYVEAWEAYVTAALGGPLGVREGCAPLRFPATSEYRGVVVVRRLVSSLALLHRLLLGTA